MNKMRGKKNTNQLLPYLLLLPVMLYLTVFKFFPFIKSIYLTFFVTNNLGVPGAFVGIKNYKRVFTDAGFWNSIVATFIFAAIVGIGTFFLAMIFSLMCVKKVRGGKIYQVMFSLPMAIASVPLCAIAIFILSTTGLLNAIIGKEIQWLADKKYALTCVALLTVWSSVGSSFIFLLVGFRGVPEELLESATIDGANAIQKVFKVYIPIASPQIFFVIFLNILNSFKAFAVIKILVGKGPADSTNTLVYAIYSNAFLRGRFETACVYSLVLCLVIFIFTKLQMACEKRMVFYK